MKTEKHISYPNPAIIEAICEFHFVYQEDAQNNWDGKWYGRLHSKLGEDYEMEPKIAKGVIVQTTNDAKATLYENLIPINQMLYKHKTKDQLIQLAPWILTVNEIGHYSGWKTFLEHIEYALKALFSTIDPIQVRRIGMRYINRIPKTSHAETVGDWINNNDLLPKCLLTQQKNFFFRCEIPQTDDIRMIVTVTEEQINEEIKPIIFDIDTLMIKDNGNINNSLTLLHNIIRNVFDHSLTEKFENFLKQVPKRGKL